MIRRGFGFIFPIGLPEIEPVLESEGIMCFEIKFSIDATRQPSRVKIRVLTVGRMIDSHELPPGSRSARSRAPLWRPLLYTQAMAFAAYTMLVGYLIGESHGRQYAMLALFSLAMALRFLAMSLGLRRELAEAYDRFERWLLAAAILAGWALAQFTEVPYWSLALCKALFAGMLIFFVIRSEIPSPKDGHFIPLLLGAVGYSALALVIEAL